MLPDAKREFTDAAAGKPRDPRGFQLRLLKLFDLRRGDTRIPLPVGPQRLLAFLAIQGPAPRLMTIGILWPGVGEPHARASLRTAIWRLHGSAPGIVRRAGDMLFLSSDVAVDTHAAAGAAEAILQDPGQFSAGQVVLRSTGDLLPGWRDDWVIFERERLRQLQLHALDALAERFAEQGRYVDALEAATESARIEPLRESANRVIIKIHLAEGNVAEAVRHYEFFCTTLRADLGIGPSASLTAMLPSATLQSPPSRRLRIPLPSSSEVQQSA